MVLKRKTRESEQERLTIMLSILDIELYSLRDHFFVVTGCCQTQMTLNSDFCCSFSLPLSFTHSLTRARTQKKYIKFNLHNKFIYTVEVV